MHVAYAGDRIGPGGEGQFRASFPPVSPATTAALSNEPADYGAQRRPNVSAIVTVLAVHAIVLVGLVKADVIPIHRKPPPPLVVVDLIAEPPAPPPPPAAPEPEVQQVKQVQPVIVSPPPIVAVQSAPPPVAVVAEAPPPQAVVVAPAPKAAAASGPVSVDLSTKMVAGSPPRYPTESRRKREQGTVVLRLTLGEGGGVADIGISRSSGFDRLDRAAMDAVRRWRWSPTIVNGQPVQVRGLVEIPFVLKD